MKILNRYVLREHAGPLTFALAALTSLLLLNYIAKNIGQLVGKGLPWTVIVEFISLSIPFTVAMTLPMAVLVAVLYGFSRLAAENEITALKASGVSVGRVLIPVVIGAFGLTLLMVGFNDQVLPRANHRLRTLQSDIARKKPTFALRPRVINEVSPGKLFLAAAHIDQATSRLREVTIYDLGDPTRDRTIYADSGLMALSPVTGELELTLFDGSMDEVQKATPSELQRMFYKVDLIRVKGVGDQLTRSTNDDFKSDREMTVCELQQNVESGEDAEGRAVAEVRRVMVNAVRAAATGVAPPRAPVVAQGPPPQPGLGRSYCRALAAVGQWIDRVQGPKHRSAPPPPPAVQPAKAIGAVASLPPSAGGGAGAPAVRPPGADLPPQQPVLPPHPPVFTPQQQTTQPQQHAMPSRQQTLPPHQPAFSPQRQAMQPQQRALPPRTGLPGAGARVPTAQPGVPGGPAYALQHPVTQGRPQIIGQRPLPVVAPPVYHPPAAMSPVTMNLTMLTSTVEATRAEVDNGLRTVNLYDNQIHKMFAIAVACVIFVFLGAPIALRFPRGGVGMVLGVSLGVFALYYIGLIAGEPLAQRGTVSPWLAMWTSNIVFGIVGFFLMTRLGRESSTSRGSDWQEFKDRMGRRLAGLFAGRRRETALSTEGA